MPLLIITEENEQTIMNQIIEEILRGILQWTIIGFILAIGLPRLLGLKKKPSRLLTWPIIIVSIIIITSIIGIVFDTENQWWVSSLFVMGMILAIRLPRLLGLKKKPSRLLTRSIIIVNIIITTSIIGIVFDTENQWWVSSLFIIVMVIMYFGIQFIFPRLFKKQDTTLGSAKFGSIKEMKASGRLQPAGDVLKDSHGFVLGRANTKVRGLDSRLRYMGHLLTCAPTGAGKGVGAVIPALLEYPGSTITLDIKGENFVVTARARRAMNHQVYCIDPFGVTNEFHGFNWLDAIDIRNENCISDAATLAETIVIRGSDNEAYWDDSAKDLIQGLILFCCTLKPKQRHIATVRNILTTKEVTRNTVLHTMSDMKAGFGIIARAANAFLAKADRERSSVLSSAIRHTAFLDDPRIVKTVSRSDFDMNKIKQERMSIYLVIPPNKLASNTRFVRGFIGLALNAVTSSHHKPEYKTLFLLDEFSQLGRMQSIEEAISLVRGYGAVFWLIIQDLSQLKFAYKEKWQTFLANTAKQFFGTADYETAKYISDMMGQETINFETSSSSEGYQGGSKFGSGIINNSGSNSSVGVNQHKQGRSLMTPDEVMRYSNVVIALIAGEHPYLLDPIKYYKDEAYQGLFDRNPYL